MVKQYSMSGLYALTNKVMRRNKDNEEEKNTSDLTRRKGTSTYPTTEEDRGEIECAQGARVWYYACVCERW